MLLIFVCIFLNQIDSAVNTRVISGIASILSYCMLEVTIVAQNDYCDSIDIAGSTIAILLLLWTTIAILL